VSVIRLRLQLALRRIVGIGLAEAFGVITLALALLRRMTAPSTIRFE